MNHKSESIYQIKIKLLSFKPWIWRRVLVPGGATLRELHLIIQRVMPWDGGHLHQFVIEGENYGMTSKELDLGWIDDALDEKRFTLERLALPAKYKFLYEYDFGDDWEHEITIEKILAKDPNQFYPICIDGENAAPPDDCGGVWGYTDLLEIIADPDHSDYDSRMEWLGGDFDPKNFDIDQANLELERLFRKTKSKLKKSSSLNANT